MNKPPTPQVPGDDRPGSTDDGEPDCGTGPVPAPRATAATNGHRPTPVPNPRSQDTTQDQTPNDRRDDTQDDDYRYISSGAKHSERVAQVTTRAMAVRLPRLLGQALRLAWGCDRRALTALLVCQVASGVLEAAGLLATTATITAVLSSGDVAARLRDAAPALTLLALAVGARAGLGIAVRYLARRLAPLLSRKAETLLLEATAGAELAAYDTADFKTSYGAADRGAESVRGLLTYSQNFIAAAASFVAAATVMTYLHPLLLPLLLLGAVPRGVAAVRAARIEYRSTIVTQGERQILAVLRWNITDKWGANQLRSSSIAPHLLARYQRVADRVQNVVQDAALREAKVSIIGALAGGLAAGLMWTAVCWLLASGRMSVAAAGTAVIGLRTVTTALGGIVSAGTEMYGIGLYLDDWSTFLQRAGGHSMRLGRGTTRLARPTLFRAENVSYTYAGEHQRPALDGVDLDVRVGSIVALVGENGSGKSTLANLLTGLYLPTDGRVTWDGADSRDLDPADAFRHVSYLTQDVVRWPLPFHENVTLGQRRPDHDDTLAYALAASGADEVAAALPRGLRTLLGAEFAGGTSLSGGQFQRVYLARAFYRDSPLLVLDEPTSALDPRAEHRIFTRLREHARERAVVLVTHRLTNVALADEIIVLDHGKVVQRGAFEELKAQQHGLFFELWQLQQDRGTEPQTSAAPRDTR